MTEQTYGGRTAAGWHSWYLTSGTDVGLPEFMELVKGAFSRVDEARIWEALLSWARDGDIALTNGEIHKLLTAVKGAIPASATSPAVGWQPIESAPKDGSEAVRHHTEHLDEFAKLAGMSSCSASAARAALALSESRKAGDHLHPTSEKGGTE